jgi:hypothetical protein
MDGNGSSSTSFFGSIFGSMLGTVVGVVLLGILCIKKIPSNNDSGKEECQCGKLAKQEG